jgi:ATP/maltotriose-dependent transcriptional regulator MalT
LALGYKRFIPTIAKHVRRESLQHALDAAISCAPVTWVVGLPGSGKTSAVAAWVRGATTPCAWYRLDASDADPAGLFDALASATPTKVPAWNPDNGADLKSFARQFFGALAETPLTVVVDDCHRVPDDCALVEVLTHALENSGDALKVVVISRRAPPPTMVHATFQGKLSVVDELRLSDGEARAIVEGLRRREPSEEALRAADGWLAHLLASSSRGVTVTEERIADFLAAEILESLPTDAERDAFRLLARLPEIPTRTPNEALLPGEVSSLLDALAAQRYFVDLLASDRWRLHDLLREGLLQTNTKTEPVRLRALAEWVRGTFPEAAMPLFAEVRDLNALSELLEEHGNSWLTAGLHHTLAHWLEDVPLEGQPQLAFWRAQALLPSEPEHARPLFARARSEAVTHALAIDAWCGEVSSYVVQWGAVAGLAQLVDELEKLEARFGALEGELAFKVTQKRLVAMSPMLQMLTRESVLLRNC